MSWFKQQKKTSYLRSFCNNVIKSGPLPQHVAIIMDGNRRFAKKVNCERSKGHEKGFEKLTEVRGFMNNFGSLQFTQISFPHTEQHFSVCDAFKLACLLAENSDVSCEIIVEMHLYYTSTEIFVVESSMKDIVVLKILSFIVV